MTRPHNKWDDVSRIQYADSLKVGRQRFAKTFGFAPDSKKVDAAIIGLFGEADDRRIDGQVQESTIAVPIELILALTLREGFGRGKGRTRKSNPHKRKFLLAIKKAERLRTKFIAEEMPRGAARDRAIREVAEQEGVDASILRDQMSRSRK
jgi:hypothetical protein